MLNLRTFSEIRANALDTSTFEKWKSKIMDKNSICFNDDDGLTIPTLDTKHHHVPLFEFAKDCSENGARWDYQIQPPKLGKHLNTSNAYATFKIPRKGSKHPEKFGTGLKWNNCLKFRYDVPHAFSGKLANGKMQGKVIVKFKDGIFIEGYAKNSMLQHFVQYFNKNNEDTEESLNLTAHFLNGKHVIRT